MKQLTKQIVDILGGYNYISRKELANAVSPLIDQLSSKDVRLIWDVLSYELALNDKNDIYATIYNHILKKLEFVSDKERRETLISYVKDVVVDLAITEATLKWTR